METALLTLTMPKGLATSSSPPSTTVPSRSRLPYRPGPTMIRSPATARAMACVIVRQGAVDAPHPDPFTPWLATYSVAAVAGPGSSAALEATAATTAAITPAFLTDRIITALRSAGRHGAGSRSHPRDRWGAAARPGTAPPRQSSDQEADVSRRWPRAPPVAAGSTRSALSLEREGGGGADKARSVNAGLIRPTQSASGTRPRAQIKAVSVKTWASRIAGNAGPGRRTTPSERIQSQPDSAGSHAALRSR
jgi:hypothetical protein